MKLSAPFGLGAGYAALVILATATVLLVVAMLRTGVLPVVPLMLFIGGPIVFLGVMPIFGSARRDGDPLVTINLSDAPRSSLSRTEP